MLKAVIFDLDGLLVDSTPAQEEAFERFVTAHSKIFLPSNGGSSGKRIIDIVREYKDLYDLPGEVEDLYEERQKIFYALAKEKIKLSLGATELIEKFRKRNLKLALATSGDSYYVKLLQHKFSLLQSAFSVVITSEDVERGKPFPDVYQKAISQLQVSPDEAIVLEDSVNGILAAKAAGIQVIGVPNQYYPNADYSVADRVFPSLKEVAVAIV